MYFSGVLEKGMFWKRLRKACSHGMGGLAMSAVLQRQISTSLAASCWFGGRDVRDQTAKA